MSKRFSTDPLTLVPLAWNPDFSIDKDSFVGAIDYLKSFDAFSLYFGCTASEGHALGREQLTKLTKLFVDELKDYDHPKFIGLAGFSLGEMNERIELLKDLGIDTFLVALPGWGQLATPGEVDLFFDRLMGTHPDCQFILYNNARSTPRLLAPDLLRLAKAHPNFVAVKQGGHAYVDARFSAVIEEEMPLVEYYLDFAWTYANLFFTPSFMPSTLSCSIKTALAFYHAGLRKDFKRLAEIDREVQKADQLLASLFPGDRVDGAYDKMWLKLGLPDFPLRLFPPYECFPDEMFQEYAAKMKAMLPHWFD